MRPTDEEEYQELIQEYEKEAKEREDYHRFFKNECNKRDINVTRYLKKKYPFKFVYKEMDFLNKLEEELTDAIRNNATVSNNLINRKPTDDEEYQEILQQYMTNKKRYYENFKKKNVFKETCEVCQGHYNYYSKKKHLQTQKHLKCVFIQNLN